MPGGSRKAQNWTPRERADQYTDAIIDYCRRLTVFPNLGRARDDIRPGIRTIGFKGRVLIAFVVTEGIVTVIGIFYGGRDYVAMLSGKKRS